MNTESFRNSRADLGRVPNSRRAADSALYSLATLLAMAVGLAFVSGAARAQDDSLWSPLYQRVRIVTADDSLHRHEGTIREISGDTLVLENHSGRIGELRIPSANIRAIQISTGQKSHALVGALLGGVAGAAISYTAIATSEEHAFYMNEQAPRDIALSAAGGALAGAIIGSFVKTEHWQDVPHSRIQLGLRPSRATRTFMVAVVSF